MSIKAMTWVWDRYEGKGPRLLAMLALADWCDDEGTCFPSMGRLAEKCRIENAGSMRKIVADLEKSGDIIRDVGGGKMTASGPTNKIYLCKYRLSRGLPSSDELEGRNEAKSAGKITGARGGRPKTVPNETVETVPNETVFDDRDRSKRNGGTVPNETVKTVPNETPDTSVESSVESSVGGEGDQDNTQTIAAPPPPLPMAKGEECQIFDPPSGPKLQPSHSGKEKPTARRGRVVDTYIDPRKLRNGYIPRGTGETALEIYHEAVPVSQERKLGPFAQAEIEEKATDLPAWRAVIAEWVLSGYNPANVGGMLDKYKQRLDKYKQRIEGSNNYGSTNHKPKWNQPKPAAELPAWAQPDDVPDEIIARYVPSARRVS